MTNKARTIAQKADEQRLKRLAIQIVAQLPEDTKEAMTVLRYCADLVTAFLATEGGGKVISLIEKTLSS